jgi:hypothetical protein
MRVSISSKFLLDTVVLQVLPNFGQFFENTEHGVSQDPRSTKIQNSNNCSNSIDPYGFVVRNFSLRNSKKLKSV